MRHLASAPSKEQRGERYNFGRYVSRNSKEGPRRLWIRQAVNGYKYSFQQAIVMARKPRTDSVAEQDQKMTCHAQSDSQQKVFPEFRPDPILLRAYTSPSRSTSLCGREQTRTRVEQSQRSHEFAWLGYIIQEAYNQRKRAQERRSSEVSEEEDIITSTVV